MSISRDEVDHIALLARLELSDEERELFTAQLGDILKYVEKLKKADVSGVEPTSHALDRENVFREDEPLGHLPVEKVLQNAPDRTENSFKVPKVLD